MANQRIAYGLCKKYGIKLKEGATPADAWKALKEAGHGDEVEKETSGGEYDKGNDSKVSKKPSLAQKQALDLLQVSNSKYKDPDKVELMKSPKGNWIIYYEGKDTGVVVHSSAINEDDAIKNNMIIQVDDDDEESNEYVSNTRDKLYSQLTSAYQEDAIDEAEGDTKEEFINSAVEHYRNKIKSLGLSTEVGFKNMVMTHTSLILQEKYLIVNT